ncbi:hypothetical protein [Demequina sp.]|uniref:hypothetical protein n=1 Tax=Demequina sp. TaxID=2050685 RepID=UPI0025BEB021|nr:hypothetical protein [Demequina sp.]
MRVEIDVQGVLDLTHRASLQVQDWSSASAAAERAHRAAAHAVAAIPAVSGQCERVLGPRKVLAQESMTAAGLTVEAARNGVLALLEQDEQLAAKVFATDGLDGPRGLTPSGGQHGRS